MLDFTKCDCKKCIHSHDRCSYRESCEELFKKLEDVDELGVKKIRLASKPFSKPREVILPFTFTAECMWFREIPKKEISNE